MLNIRKKQEDGTLTVTLEGAVDTHTAPVLLSEVEPMLDSLTALTLDFEKVDYISSAGLRVLLTFEQILEEQEKSMELIHVSEIIRDVFEVMGFTDIMNIS